ncbi:MAG: phosphatase PAP2 family protein [Anaerolineae bacterium]
MEAVWQWGLDFIHTIQLVHGPALDAFFKAITFMGEEEFFMIVLPLILWCVDFAVGIRVGVIFLLSPYVNGVFKDWFDDPRPFELDPTVQRYFSGAEGYGLPSGHSQNSVVLWGAVAASFRKTWLWVVAILLPVMVGFSRVYLGVHFPSDVLGGWTIGVVLLAVYLRLGPRIEAWLRERELVWQLALAVAVPLVLLLLYSTASAAVSSIAVLMGLGIGGVLTRQMVPFSAAGPLWQRAVRFLVGLVGMGILYLGLSAVFPSEGEPLYFIMRVVRYALMGLWAGLGAPWLFLRLRLASSE